jgi:hypothetical protein
MNMTYRKSRKRHNCYCCGGDIKPGQFYCDHGKAQRECWRCIGLISPYTYEDS